MSRRATRFNKRDSVEPDIVGALAAMGVLWIEGPPLDGWVWFGQFIPVELKTSEGIFTQSQKDFIEICELNRWPYRVWRSVDEAVESVNLWRSGG